MTRTFTTLAPSPTSRGLRTLLAAAALAALPSLGACAVDPVEVVAPEDGDRFEPRVPVLDEQDRLAVVDPMTVDLGIGGAVPIYEPPGPVADWNPDPADDGPAPLPEEPPAAIPDGPAGPTGEAGPTDATPPPAEPDFAAIELQQDATFDYDWSFLTADGEEMGTMTLTLRDSVDREVPELGAVVTMYRVETTGDLAPGVRVHQYLGAHENLLIGGRMTDGALETTILFDPNDGGYIAPHGFSGLLPLVDTHLFSLGTVDDGRSTYDGMAVWASTDAVELYRAGIGFSGLDIQGTLTDAQNNQTDARLRMALVTSSLVP